MHKCSASPAPIVKSDRYGDFQCPENQYELNQMKAIPYAYKRKSYIFTRHKWSLLTYRRSVSMHIVGYSDFNYARDDKKSMLGNIFTLIGGAISWKSSKQTVTTSSIMYTEFVACNEAMGQVNWLKKFIPSFEGGRQYT
jgi:hypothetical protein